jgi:eukaryotic-like serine/threonine-protein kinase
VREFLHRASWSEWKWRLAQKPSDRRLRKLTWAVVLGFVALLLGIASVFYFAFFLPQQRFQRTTAQSATPEPAVQPTAAPTQSSTAQTTTGEDRAKTSQPATGKELLTLKGHSEGVTSVAFSPDGRRIVTGSGDNTAKVWDAQTGKELRTLSTGSYAVNSVAFSPDGTRIVTGSVDNTAKVWDAQSGKELLTLRGHSDRVNSVAFSPDGKRIVTGSDDGTAKVWAVQSGRTLLTLKVGDITHSTPSALYSVPPAQWVQSVAFSPDGTRIVTGSGDATAKVWDVQSGKKLLTLIVRKTATHTLFSEEEQKVYSVTFSPDGKRIANGSGDHTAKVWDAQSGKELLTFGGNWGSVDAVAFSPDGTHIVTGSSDNTAEVWDAQSGKELMTLNGHSDDVNSVAFSPDGKRIVTGSGDKTAKVWDATLEE